MTTQNTHETTPHPTPATLLDFDIDIDSVAVELAHDVEALPRRAPLFALMGAIVLADAVILGALALSSGCADPSIDQYALEAENTGASFSTDTDVPGDTAGASGAGDGTDCDCPCDDDGAEGPNDGEMRCHPGPMGPKGHRPPPFADTEGDTDGDPDGDTNGDTGGDMHRRPPHPPFGDTDGDTMGETDGDTDRLPPPHRCRCGEPRGPRPPRDGQKPPMGPHHPRGPRPGDTDGETGGETDGDADGANEYTSPLEVVN